MEYVSSNRIKLRDIFLDNGNWWKLFLKHQHLIRQSIIISVLKLLVCRTSFLGYHHFVCLNCSIDRDLKRNIHIHLSTTTGGLSFSHDTWINGTYFYHQSLKNTWRYKIISLLREEFKEGKLILPSCLGFHCV